MSLLVSGLFTVELLRLQFNDDGDEEQVNYYKNDNLFFLENQP